MKAATVEAPLSRERDDAELSRATVRRVTVRLIPFLFVLFVCNYLDRNNIGIAKLQMARDLSWLSESVYGFGAGVFFIGYSLLEVPSNLILERVGARLWIARIMIGWGLVSIAMMAVSGKWSFYLLRVLLGIAEAGFFPGVILYLTYWVPSAHRARTSALSSPSSRASPPCRPWPRAARAQGNQPYRSSFHGSAWL